MEKDWILWGLLLLPVGLALLSLVLNQVKQILWLVSLGGSAWSLLALGSAVVVFEGGTLQTAKQLLFMDALSAYHALILALVFGMSSLFSKRYFETELERGSFPLGSARKFSALWFGSAVAMISVLLCNNLGFMWVSIEATTLLTAFLISIHQTPLSLEAMWKYLLVCSVGVAFAFVGTLLVAAAAGQAGIAPGDTLLWSKLKVSAAEFDPGLMKVAFVFLLVGYGTKTGIAPMHTWLPDAHSQAPAPVSALLSGFILNAALYCIMRYLPLVDSATGGVGWGRHLLVLLGSMSVGTAATFIVFQRDGKRLFAYSSVEHMGFIVLGMGFGGIGTFAALWHTLNHAVCKPLAFFSVGRLGQMYGTHDLGKLGGAMRRSPVWGLGFFGSALVLIGAAPFAIFMSEFLVLRGALDAQAYWTLSFILLAAAVVFLSVLFHAIGPAWGEADPAVQPTLLPETLTDKMIVFGSLGLILVLGIWLPDPLKEAMLRAARVIGGGS